MTKLFHTIITVLVILLVAATACTVGYWAYFILHWPWWIALAMSFGVVGIYLFFLFVKKYLIRRREKRFVQRVVEQSDVLSNAERPETQSILDLEQSWKSNLDTLRKSHLKKQGNPLYVLPWYLAMGESGSGKTTMLTNAGVQSSFTEIADRQGEVGPTRNCDWFFFDQAVILDTAGRYSIPPGSDRDIDEWKRFLLLLTKCRRKEPLNGIVLFVAADSLLAEESVTLQKKAQVLRNRIHSLMRMIGYRMPVCVMVAKMDKVPGFTEFVGLLSEEERKEAMGFSASSENIAWQELADKTFESLDKALRSIRLAKISSPAGREPSFFSLVTQLEPLKQRLAPFLDTLFTENRYQETPYLHGIYFGTGTCTDSPGVSYLKRYSAAPVKNPMHTSGFSRDFFIKVLPEMRWLFKPVKEFLVWRTITRNLALLSWLCLLIFFGGGIGLSYLHNRTVLSAFPVPQETTAQPVPGSNAALVGLEKIRLNIVDLEKLDNKWRFPFQMFTTADSALEAYKENYCKLFETTLLNPMEERFEQAADSNAIRSSAPEYAKYVGYVVEQITFLQRHLDGKAVDPDQVFGTRASAVLAIQNPKMISEVGKYFPNLNGAYLAWHRDEPTDKERLIRLRSTLNKLLNANRGEVSWLYADSVADSAPITLADFWRSTPDKDKAQELYVPGAFTQKGRNNIDLFLQAIKKTGIAKEAYQELLDRYHRSYPLQFVHWWQKFVSNFADGELGLTSDFQWRETAILMTSPQNPYFSLLEKLSGELKAFTKDTGAKPPAWGKAMMGLNKIRVLTATASKNQKESSPSLLPKIASEESRIQAEFLEKVDPSQAAAMDEELTTAQAWNQYQEGLKGLDALTPYKEKAAGEFTAWFKQAKESDGGDTLFGNAYSALVTLHTLARDTYPSELAWKLVYGPFTFLGDFAAYHTATVLQEKWQEEVLAATAGADPGKMDSLLFDKNQGAVWAYLQKYADPFVEQSINGFKPRQAYGRSLHFVPPFYTFVNQAKHVVVNEQPQYSVSLQTTPMEVNDSATVEPLYATLSLKCAKQTYSLENDNFPRSITIDWAPDKCGDVTLKIGLPTIEVEKVWSGNLGLAHFLDDFKSGWHRFSGDDFPEQQGYFKAHSITHIDMGYSIDGAKEVVRLLAPVPSQVPRTIIYPQDQRSVTPDQHPRSAGQPEPLKVQSPPLSHPDTQAQLPAEASTAQGNPPLKAAVDKMSPYHDENWLLDQADRMYTVQLMSLTSKKSITRGFALLPDDQVKAAYQKKMGDTIWYILCSGLFAAKDDAQEYKRTLPESIAQVGPIVRSIGSIQKEIIRQQVENDTQRQDSPTPNRE